jgi:hypothetical protein
MDYDKAMSDFIDSGGFNPTPRPGIVEGIKEGVTQQAKAAGMTLGLYTPESAQEEAALRKEAKALGISTLIGLAPGLGLAGTIGKIATAGGRAAAMAAVEAFAGAGATAAYSMAKDEPVSLPSVAIGAALGGLGGALAGPSTGAAAREAALATKKSPSLLGPGATRLPETIVPLQKPPMAAEYPEPRLALPPPSVGQAADLDGPGGNLAPDPMTGLRNTQVLQEGVDFAEEGLPQFQPTLPNVVSIEDVAGKPVARIAPIAAPQTPLELHHALGFGDDALDELDILGGTGKRRGYRTSSTPRPRTTTLEPPTGGRTYEDIGNGIKLIWEDGTLIGKRHVPKGFTVPRDELFAAPTPPTNFPTKAQLISTWGEKHSSLLNRLSPNMRYKATLIGQELGQLSRNALAQPKAIISKFGKAGAWAVHSMDKVDRVAAMLTGDEVENISKLFSGLRLKEREEIVEVLRGIKNPSSKQVAEAATYIRGKSDLVINAAMKEGLVASGPEGERLLAMARKNWVPLEYSDAFKAKILNVGSKENKAAVEKILSLDHASNPAEAQEFIRRHMSAPSDVIDNHLQRIRMNVFGPGETDPLKLYPRYFFNAYRRLEMAKAFGPANEKLAQAIKVMGDNGHDAQYAADIVRNWTGKQPREYSNVIGALRSWNIISMLTYAGVMQPGQWANVVAYHGWKNFAKSMGTLLVSPSAREWARRSGAAVGEMMQDMIPIQDQGLASIYVKGILLEPADKANRFIHALAARFDAEDLAKKLIKNPENKIVQRRLELMGLNVQEILSKGGVLSPDQLRMAGVTMSRKGQFMSDTLSKPLYSQTPLGEMMYLFKNFALQQFKFTKDIMNEGLVHKNWQPLTNYLMATGTMTAGTGEVVRQLRSAIENKEDNTEGLERYLRNMVDAGAVGILWNSLQSLNYGSAAVISMVAGPGLGQLSKVGADATHAVTAQDPIPLTKDILKMGGVLGRILANAWFPPGR